MSWAIVAGTPRGLWVGSSSSHLRWRCCMISTIAYVERNYLKQLIVLPVAVRHGGEAMPCHLGLWCVQTPTMPLIKMVLRFEGLAETRWLEEQAREVANPSHGECRLGTRTPEEGKGTWRSVRGGRLWQECVLILVILGRRDQQKTSGKTSSPWK